MCMNGNTIANPNTRRPHPWLAVCLATTILLGTGVCDVAFLSNTPAALADDEASKSKFFPFPIRFGMKATQPKPSASSDKLTETASSESTETPKDSDPRKIAVKRDSGSSKIQQVQHVRSASARTKLPDDGRVVVPGTNGLPQFETPGEVTSVEVFDANGNPISGELAEGEYYYGAQPAPVHIGQPLPKTLTMPGQSSGVPFQSDAPQATIATGEMMGEPWIDESGEVIWPDANTAEQGHPGASVLVDGMHQGSSGCDECGGGCVGVCDRRIDARVRVLAHALSDPLHDLWIRADFMQLWIDGQTAPSLVTTGRAGTARDVAGQIGQLGTQTLYGGLIDDESRAAGRFEIGRYLGDTGLSVSGSILFAEDVSNRFYADGTQYSILARPFVDVTPGGANNGEAADVIQFENEMRGNVSVDSLTEFGGADALIRALLINHGDRQMESFVGYRYLQLDDQLTIHDERRALLDGGGFQAGTLLEQTDRFAVDNRFHGATMGIRSSTSNGIWSLNTQVQLGLGVTRSNVTASGFSLRSEPQAGGGVVTSQSDTGLLVRSTNSGSRDYNELAVAPEIHLSLTRHLWNNWDLSIGYQFLYLSRVLRAAEQIDPLLNQSDLTIGGFTGSRRPDPTAVYNDLLAHGITFGVYHPF